MAKAKPRAPAARHVLAANMRRLRSERGLSQEKLAALARLHPNYVGSVERRERNISIDNIEKLCQAAGTSLHNIVRVLQFHTDLDEFYPVYQVWERRLGGRPLPFSAVEVPAPLPVPGATVMIEVWAYAP